MAVLQIPKIGKVVLYIQTGTNGTGDPITSSRTFANIKSDADNDDLHAVAVALSGLMKHTLLDVTRLDASDLVNMS